MKGLTLEQHIEVMKFLQKYHAFGVYGRGLDRAQFPNMGEYGKNIKYVDTCYDSRFGDIWSITFRGFGQRINFRTNMFATIDSLKDFKYDNLFDLCMAFLKGDFVPTEEFMSEDK